MRHARTFIIAAPTILLVGALAGAQPAESPPFPGYGWGAGREFDPATLVTIEGDILEVASTPSPGWRRAQGLHLTVDTSDGPVSVHMGPRWYLQRRGVTFAAGERVTITGSRLSSGSGARLVATEVRRGESVFRLRASDGDPAWGGWGRGRGAGPGQGRAGAPPPAP
jgi:hypothetical protein